MRTFQRHRRIVLKGLKIAAAYAVLGAILACGAGRSNHDDDEEEDEDEVAAAVPLELTAGFVPDPQTATGVAGGPTDASTLGPTCRGFIPTEPQHVLNLTTGFPNLRLIVAGAGDTSLVVQKPDGTYLCDDDSGEGLSPRIEGPFVAGTHRVFIGMYASTVPGTAYTIGYTQLSSVTATTLPRPTP